MTSWDDILAKKQQLSDALAAEGLNDENGNPTQAAQAFSAWLATKDGRRYTAAKEAAEKQQARDDARSLLDAGTGESIPSDMGWDDLEATADPSFFIDGLWPEGGRVLLAGAAKAGKSTILSSLVGSLTTGSDFLDYFDVPRTSSVYVLDAELSPSQIKRYYLGAFPKTADVRFLPLRGCMGAANLLNPRVLDDLAAKIDGYDVLLVDPLGPFLAAAGVDENDNTGVRKVLMALDELMKKAGVRHLLVAHHFGHNNERSRGASVLKDWPDALWKLSMETPDDHGSVRFFGAAGRDVDLPDTVLEWDGTELALNGQTRASRKYRAKTGPVDTGIKQYVQANPGCSKADIERNVEGRGHTIRQRLDHLEHEGVLEVDRSGQKHLVRLVSVVDEAAVLDGGAE